MNLEKFYCHNTDTSKIEVIFPLKKDLDLTLGIEFQKILGLGIEKDLLIKNYF